MRAARAEQQARMFIWYMLSACIFSNTSDWARWSHLNLLVDLNRVDEYSRGLYSYTYLIQRMREAVRDKDAKVMQEGP